MSNIRTSYIRVARRDGQALTQEEMDTIFEQAVRSVHQFGSYWVRILRKERPLENCFDIQFGSSKTYGEDYFCDPAVISKYDVWVRVADEGGFSDTIYTYEYNAAANTVNHVYLQECKYKFDKIKIYTEHLPKELQSLNWKQTSSMAHELVMQGDYEACNSRSFVDLHEDSPFYGPSLGYDPHYASDYFVMIPDNHIKKISTEFLQPLVLYPYPKLEEGTKIELYWKNRLVQQIEKIGGDIRTAAADYWDNLAIS